MRQGRRSWLGRIALAVVILVLCIAATLLGFRGAAMLRETATAADVAPGNGRFVTVGDARLFIQEAGPAEGQVVLLVHGTAAWSELWRDVMDPLAASGYRVTALDLPPFGFSDRPKGRAYTRADQARRIAGLIDALGRGPVHLVGHSFGAGPTVETVMRTPDRVKSLVLVAGAVGVSSPAAPPSGVVTWLADTPAVRDLVVATLATNPAMTRTLIRMMVHRQSAADDRRVAVIQRPLVLRRTTYDLGEWLAFFMAPDPTALSLDRKRFADIRVPTTLIWGDRDEITPLAQGRDLATLIAGSRLMELRDVGHIPQIEAPEEVVPLLLEALRSADRL